MRAKQTSFLTLSLFLLLTQILFAAGPSSGGKIPDFTKGGQHPQKGSHTWNLGPIGARGWMYSDKLVTSDARQILITEVDKNSPADGILKQGDVILGVNQKPFSYDPRTELGKAISQAESDTKSSNLHLILWRDGKEESIAITLNSLGAYSDTAPYDCEKSKSILETGCKSLALRISAPGYRLNPIPRCLNALALLASGNKDYLPIVRKEAQWASQFRADRFQTWYYGYVITFLSEYLIATDDESIKPGLTRLALEASEGQSIVGSWGHSFAQPDGRLGGYGMMNSPGLPLTISLVLSRKAGVNDPKIDLAIEKSMRLIRFYIGKGAIPYGDHRPWIQTHEDNGKCGMAAVLFNLLGESEGADYFSKMSLASHGAERDTGHTGNFFNMLWALPGVAQSGPNATGVWMKEFGGWYLDLARKSDGSFIHQGPPSTKKDSYSNWDCSGAYLLAYALPLKKIYLTGKQESSIPALKMETAKTLLEDGRGWSNKDRHTYYDSLSTEELLAKLGNWSPTVRERIAIALARKKEDISDQLIQKLNSEDLFTKYGACQAVKQQRNRAAKAVPALQQTLSHQDLWLRILSAEALSGIGQDARGAAPMLLERLAKSHSQADPRKMEQRFFCFALFDQRNGLISRSLEGIDHDLLFEAVRSGLKNEDGRARGSIKSVYHNLSYEEIKPLLPAIHQAIIEPAPSGIMFASGIRLAGLELLSKHRIQEGIPLCISVMEIDKWGKKDRIGKSLKALACYGSAAKPILPQLRTLEKDLLAHREAKGLKPHIDQLHKLIENIEKNQEKIELRSLND
jgi:hypothetical protein